MFESPRFRQTAVTCLQACALLACMSLTVEAKTVTVEFKFTKQSAIFERKSGDVKFSITFNQRPDFYTVDSVGRQADSFQYFIVGDQNLSYPYNYDSIIRDEDVNIKEREITIRSAGPPDTNQR